MKNFLLKATKISKSFPGVQALDNVDLHLAPGEVHALVGENGAGKSTLIKILTGVLQPDFGEIDFDGKRCKFRDPKEALNIGISAVYQELSLVPYFSVMENIFLGDEQTKKNFGWLDSSQMHLKAKDVLKSLDIDIPPNVLVKDLSVGQRQMVELARCVLRNTKLMIMDEPTSSLSQEEIRNLFSIIDVLKRKGITIIFISHRLEEVFQVADNVTILRNGKKIGTYPSDQLNKEIIIRKMTGKALGKQFYKNENVVIGEELLSVEGLSKAGVYRDINFKLHKGEIVGFYGLVGSGRSEVMMSVFGAVPYDKGVIRIKGVEQKIPSVSVATRHKIGFIPEDRQKQGIIPDMSVTENITLSGILKDLLNRFGLIDQEKEREIVKRSIVELNIKTSGYRQQVKFLSGGNQQKVVIAKSLVAHSDIVIMDEPTRGIDVGAKEEVYHLVGKMVADGKGVIIVSSELPEVIGLADTIYVMKSGYISRKLSQKEATEEKLLQLAIN